MYRATGARGTLSMDDGLPQEETIETIEHLVRSRTRVGILAALLSNGPMEKGTIRERFDVSRTTVQRNLDTLVDRGWVRCSVNEYALTPCGKLVTEQLLGLVDAVQTTGQLRTALQWIPVEDLDFDVRHLSEADVVVSETSNPYAPVNRHVEALKSATEVRVVLSTVGLRAMDVVYPRVTRGEGEWEAVVERGVVETLRSAPEFADRFDELLATDRFSMLVTDDDIPYYLGLIDGRVQIGVEDDEGIPRALVETADPVVREWAEASYQRYARRSEPVS